MGEHLALIGLEPELASHTKLSQLGDGEKVKAVLGACMWMSPHVIVFDEPTNSLSWDSLVALDAAIKDFKGGVVVISHNQAFIDEVCNEIWLMKKDPKRGIAHLSITGGDTTDMKDIFEEASKEDTYVDGAGNVQKLKQQFSDKELKMKRRRISAMMTDGLWKMSSLNIRPTSRSCRPSNERGCDFVMFCCSHSGGLYCMNDRCLFVDSMSFGLNCNLCNFLFSRTSILLKWCTHLSCAIQSHYFMFVCDG